MDKKIEVTIDNKNTDSHENDILVNAAVRTGTWVDFFTAKDNHSVKIRTQDKDKFTSFLKRHGFEVEVKPEK